MIVYTLIMSQIAAAVIFYASIKPKRKLSKIAK